MTGFTVVCGLLGLISLLLTMYGVLGDLPRLVKSTENGNIAGIIESYNSSLFWGTITVILMLSFLAAQAYVYSKELREFQKFATENFELKDVTNRFIQVFRQGTGCMHGVIHCYRDAMILFDDVNESYEAYVKFKQTEGDCDETKEKLTLLRRQFQVACGSLEQRIVTMLSNISNALGVMTGDTCAVCIKLLSKDKKVKTFFRDPVSFRERRPYDFKNNNELFIYDVADNYAFKHIHSETLSANYFACDDLYAHPGYTNSNSSWKKLYCATGVAPIQADLKGAPPTNNDKDIVGFLCCDNRRRGFEDASVKDFILGFGDLLYRLIVTYSNLCMIAEKENFQNVKSTRFTTWSES